MATNSANSVKETLINSSVVIPAKAGIQKFKNLDSGMRRNDKLFSASLMSPFIFVGFVANYLFIRYP